MNSRGNAPITIIRQPGHNDWDMTLFKNFPVLGEGREIQFRWEAYNVLNHTQFSSVNTSAIFNNTSGAQTNSLFGQATGVNPVDQANLAGGVEFGKPETYKLNQTYPWNGVRSTAIDNCNGVKVPLTHRQSRTAYTLEIRAYNDGIAFRHVVPGEGSRVPDETTAFRLPEGSTLWYHDLEDHYEGTYVRRGLRAVPPGGYLAPPVTFQLPQGAGYAAITEGALVNYSGMGLQADGAGTLYARLAHSIPASYPFRLRYAQDVERLKKPAAITGTIATPWRVVMIGADLNALVNCDIVHNVAAPPDPRLFPDGLKTKWLGTGRALWSYLDGGNNTPEGMKEFARMAAALGFEYNLLEGFWSSWPESTLKDLVDYSRNRGVKILIRPCTSAASSSATPPGRTRLPTRFCSRRRFWSSPRTPLISWRTPRWTSSRAFPAPGMRPWSCRCPRSAMWPLSPGARATPGSWRSIMARSAKPCAWISPS